MEIWKRKIKSSGVTVLYLDYYDNGQRKRVSLNLKLYPGKDNKFINDQTMRLAEAIRAKSDHELKSGIFGLIPAHRRKEHILYWMADFVDRYNKADKRIYRATLHSFQRFVRNPEIIAGAITPRLCSDYRDHLHEQHNGETPFNYWKALKRILKAAVEAGFFRSNPMDGIKNVNHKVNELTKQTLLPKEISKLAKTICGNAEVKRAFLFSTQTGLRYGDIIRLQWKHVFLDLGYIDFGQAKTDRRNVVPLNKSASHLLGDPGRPSEKVFTLPSANGVNKDLRHWVKRAGIHKHITYHCARHSFGTNLIDAGVDLKTTSRALGHTSTRNTEKYTHISDERKRWAVKQLPGI